MRYYVTLHNMAYAAKAIAMFESLKKHSSEPFILYDCCMDDDTYCRMMRMVAGNDNTNIRIIRPRVWQDDALRALVGTRPIAELCFTSTPRAIEWLFYRTHDEVTYLDADLYFFADPKIAFDEKGKKVVGIIPHRFPEHDFARLSPNGLYNVSWVSFKWDSEVLELLLDWKTRVYAKCDSSVGWDQKQLDEWPARMGEKLHAFKSIGIGAGPWAAYTYKTEEGPKFNGEPVVFYHFHEYKHKEKLTGYPVTPEQESFIYNPYIVSVEAATVRLLEMEKKK